MNPPPLSKALWPRLRRAGIGSIFRRRKRRFVCRARLRRKRNPCHRPRRSRRMTSRPRCYLRPSGLSTGSCRGSSSIAGFSRRPRTRAIRCSSDCGSSPSRPLISTSFSWSAWRAWLARYLAVSRRFPMMGALPRSSSNASASESPPWSLPNSRGGRLYNLNSPPTASSSSRSAI